MVVPADKPVRLPEKGSMVATDVLLLLQDPPEVPVDSMRVVPTQVGAVGEMVPVDGVGCIVTSWLKDTGAMVQLLETV